MPSRTLTAVAAGLLALAGAGVLAAGAGAEINGPCTASIAGTNVKGLGATSAGDAIKVKQDAQIPVTMASSKDIDQLKVTRAGRSGLRRQERPGERDVVDA